jgi:ascorbate-specific PTS system EIIC-type component UlaA
MEWLETLKDSPFAAAIVLVVVFFIRYLHKENASRAKRDEAADKRVHELSEAFREAAKGCHETQLISVAATEKNTAVMRGVQQVMGDVEQSIKEMNGLIRAMDGALKQLDKVK